MYHAIRHRGITDVTLAACQSFVCDICCKWNQAAHGMQHYQYPVGERVGTSYGMDVFYCYGRCVLLLVDTLSEFVHVVDLGSSDGAGEVPLPVYVGGPTGAGRVWRALKPVLEVSALPKVLFVDNECRMSKWLVEQLRTVNCEVRPSIPNTHSNGISEVHIKRMRGILYKQGSGVPFAVRLRASVAGANNMFLRRLGWRRPVDVPTLTIGAQRSLADAIMREKDLNRSRKLTRRKRPRKPLPPGPTDYLMRPVGVRHPDWRGPLVGLTCTIH
jgi:hypothetical protein